MASLTDIASALIATRTPYGELKSKIPDDPGFYGIFVAPANELSATVIASFPPEQPVYAGKAKKGLGKRLLEEHFSVGKTGSSTVRRTFAALLRTALDLKPIRRGNTGKDQDFNKYKLDEASENRLDEWMKRHLEVGWWAFTGPANQLQQYEASLITHLQPPLNLQHSSHPSVASVKSLRAECVVLAKAAAR